MLFYKIINEYIIFILIYNIKNQFQINKLNKDKINKVINSYETNIIIKIVKNFIISFCALLPVIYLVYNKLWHLLMIDSKEE